MNWPHGRPIGDTYCTDRETFLEPNGPGYAPTIDETIAWMRARAEYQDRITTAASRAFDREIRRVLHSPA